MKPGERLRLLGEAAERLAARPFSEAQVTVKLFDFKPWGEDQWAEMDKGWWMNCLADSDGDLQGLASFLKGEDAAPEPSPAAWASMPLSLFLSHLHDHRDFVGRVQTVLQGYGISSFVAHKDIPSGKLWRDEIRGGLRSCNALVAFLHKGFRSSQWCDQEVGWALGREIPVIPVRPPGESESPNGFIDDVQYVTLKTEDEWYTAREILTVLVAEDRTRKAALRAMAEALVNSPSYADTRWIWGMIEPHEAELESDTLRRLEYATQTNNQVYNAVRTPDGTPIPDLVSQMVERLEPRKTSLPDAIPPTAAPAANPDPWTTYSPPPPSSAPF